MNDEHPTSEDTTDSRVENRASGPQSPHREEQAVAEEADAEPTDGSGSGVGITDADMDQIRSFLQKQHHRRSVDDLRPSSER